MQDREQVPQAGRNGAMLTRYRAVVLSESGTSLSSVPLTATTDEVAISMAETMVDGHAIDLWEGLRFIEHFPAVDRPA